MRKNYRCPEMMAKSLNVIDVITASTALDLLERIEAELGGKDPAMEDIIDD